MRGETLIYRKQLAKIMLSPKKLSLFTEFLEALLSGKRSVVRTVRLSEAVIAPFSSRVFTQRVSTGDERIVPVQLRIPEPVAVSLELVDFQVGFYSQLDKFEEPRGFASKIVNADVAVNIDMKLDVRNITDKPVNFLGCGIRIAVLLEDIEKFLGNFFFEEEHSEVAT